MKLFLIAGVLALACATASAAKSECETHKEKESKNTGPLKLDVKCLDNGDYAPLQCFPGNKFCYCALPDGNQVTQPSKLKKACGCDLEKAKIDKKLSVNGRPIDPSPDTWVPACQKSGAFEKKQCNAGKTECWCLNEKGEQTSKDKKKDITCA